MCRVSFNQVGELLRHSVGCHGGVLVATPGEIVRHLQRELDRKVDPSAIDHFALTLGRWGMAISPYGDTRGAVVMLRDVKKFPLVKDVTRLSSVHIAPEAKVVLNEHKHAVAV